MYTRWVSTQEGVKLSVPDEWLGKKVGYGFGPATVGGNGLMQEIQ
jgi:hypothetical protein